MTDIDSQFERRGGHEDFEFAILELALRIQAQLAGQTTMMCSNHVFAHTFGQVKRDALSQAARVHKNQRRSVLLDQLTDAVVNLIPQFVTGNWPKLLTRNFDRQVHLALMAYIDDNRI